MNELPPLDPIAAPVPAGEWQAHIRPSALGPAATASLSFDTWVAAARTEGQSAGAAEGVGERFEAAVLTPLMAAVLPPDDSIVWGGSAGKLWRGLFAEELAAATARSGGIGIASLIDRAIAARTGEEG